MELDLSARYLVPSFSKDARPSPRVALGHLDFLVVFVTLSPVSPMSPILPPGRSFLTQNFP